MSEQQKTIPLPSGTIDLIAAASARADQLKYEFMTLEREVTIAITVVLDMLGIKEGNYRLSEDKRSLVLVTENQGG